MSQAAIERRGFTPPSGTDLTSVESTNPLIKGYLTLKPSIDLITGLKDRVTATLADTFSQPLTPPSSPLRPEEFPSQSDIATAEAAALNPERSLLPKWALRLAIPGTGLAALACSSTIPQEVKRPAIVEPASQPTSTAKAEATATAIGVGQVLVPTGDKEIDDIGEKLAKGEKVDEKDILKWNAAITTRAESTATAEAQKSPTTEVKAEVVPCMIVSPELCAQTDRIERPNARGDIVTYIGLRLPSATKIFSPIDGQVAKVQISQGASLQGFQASISRFDGSTSFTITGDLIFPHYLSLNEKQGTLIGEVGDRGIQNLGDYNVVISAGRFDPTKGYAVSAVDTLKELFPNAFQKPAKRVENTGTGQYFGGNIYLGGR